MSAYDVDLDKSAANYQPLTPLTFLARSAAVYPDQLAIIHGRQRVTYARFYERTRQLASALCMTYSDRNDALLADTELDLLGDIHVAVVYGTDFGPHSTVPAIVGMCEPGTFDGGVPVVSVVATSTTPDTGPSD